MNNRPPEVELLAPAGNWDCARAAVENGADAIYFGLEAGFNARARAANFHVDDLPKLMDMLHRQAVRGYVTLNTLVFTEELPRLEENVRLLAGSGVDAVLVQDLGAACLIRELCPDLEIHASTQMTLTCAESIRLAEELGVERVVLARELSITEIRKIAADTKMPLEVFVHGALCVAYSGQCLTSESLGGRSANRGQCAQACRLPYEIIQDGQKVEQGDNRYLLSPQDLAAHDLIDELIDAGVCSMKIEGRLKTPEYVANVCQHYRGAIDSALAKQPKRLSETEQRELELSFSRGFSPGWLKGCDHKMLVPGLSSTKRGVFAGDILKVGPSELTVRLTAPLAAGDGVVVEGDRFANEEIGGRIFELVQQGQKTSSVSQGEAKLLFQRGLFAAGDIEVGSRLYKTDDPKLTKRLRRSFQSADPIKRVKVDLRLSVHVGKPIRVQASLQAGSAQDSTIEFEHDFCPEQARKHPISQQVLAEQLARLGGTHYALNQLVADLSGSPMVPHSVLGEIRRQLVEQLDALPRIQRLEVKPHNVASQLLETLQPSAIEPVASSSLHVLCRSLVQLRQVLAAGVKSVIADFHDLRDYHLAGKLCDEAGAELRLATLRIHKPGERGLFLALKKHQRPWLARSLAAIEFCKQQQIDFVADFSLNVTNPLTASQLLSWGAQRITASYDLNREQLIDLMRGTSAEYYEVVIHQHMPMFHMEHCVFCSVLSPGKNKTDCGRPCDRHDVKLADRIGAEHVLHADIGCRNTLYNATPQSAAEAVADLYAAGVRNFRVELLRDSSEEQTQQLISLYSQLLAGKLKGSDVWRTLKADNRVGVTRGTLEQTRNPLAII